MKSFLSLVILTNAVLATFACKFGGTILGTGVTEADKNEILTVHNRMREFIANGKVPRQPAAENMLEFIWDDELAARAQRWTENCYFEHDEDVDLGRFIMGQNMGLHSSTHPTEQTQISGFTPRIEDWYNEHYLYTFGQRFSVATGHYTQLVWADTYLVGCGYSYYYQHNKYYRFYVCNYGEGGNVEGEVPYKKGQPSCAKHGLSQSLKYAGLCSINNGYAGYAGSNSVYETPQPQQVISTVQPQYYSTTQQQYITTTQPQYYSTTIEPQYYTTTLQPQQPQQHQQHHKLSSQQQHYVYPTQSSIGNRFMFNSKDASPSFSYRWNNLFSDFFRKHNQNGGNTIRK